MVVQTHWWQEFIKLNGYGILGVTVMIFMITNDRSIATFCTPQSSDDSADKKSKI